MPDGPYTHILSQAVGEAISDAATSCDWQLVLELLARQGRPVKATCPGDPSLFAPLHHAAHGGAPTDVVQQLRATGAWRTLQNARGERLIDVAERLVREYALRLPELEPLLELEHELEEAGVEARLVGSSYSRLVGGSGQRHLITPEGSTLVEEGFAQASVGNAGSRASGSGQPRARASALAWPWRTRRSVGETARP